MSLNNYYYKLQKSTPACPCIDDYKGFNASPYLNDCDGVTTITPTNGAFVNGSGFYEFDGINDYLDDGSKIESSIFTFSTWVNFDNINIDNRLMSYRLDGNNYLLVRLTVGNVFEIRYRSGVTATTGSFLSNLSYSAGTWYNFVVGIDGDNTVKMWVNGSPITIQTISTGTRSTASAPHKIGGDDSRTMDGQMGQFKTSGCMLSDAEVLLNFNNQKSVYGL